jgi:hypothetical protein
MFASAVTAMAIETGFDAYKLQRHRKLYNEHHLLSEIQKTRADNANLAQSLGIKVDESPASKTSAPPIKRSWWKVFGKGAANTISVSGVNIASAVLTANPIMLGVAAAFGAIKWGNASFQHNSMEKTYAAWKTESADLREKLGLQKEQHQNLDALQKEYEKCALENAQLIAYKEKHSTDPTPNAITMEIVTEAVKTQTLQIKPIELQPTGYGEALRDTLSTFSADTEKKMFDTPKASAEEVAQKPETPKAQEVTQSPAIHPHAPETPHIAGPHVWHLQQESEQGRGREQGESIA